MSDRELKIEQMAKCMGETFNERNAVMLVKLAEEFVDLCNQSSRNELASKVMIHSQWSGDMGEEVIAVQYLKELMPPEQTNG